NMSSPINLGRGVSVQIMFSPNTPRKFSRSNREMPSDMRHVFQLMASAKQVILFLAFDPGTNSILDEAGKILTRNPNLFVRGAVTSPQRVSRFAQALSGGGSPDQEGEEDQGNERNVMVVGDAGAPRSGSSGAPVDFRPVPAGALTRHDVFGSWERELA